MHFLEVSPTSSTTCRVCSASIARGEVRVKRTRFHASTYYFHLQCLRPELNVPMRLEDFNVDKAQMQVELLKAHIEGWNKQFLMTETQVPEQYVTKAVVTLSTPLRRRLLMTFTFLSVKEVETLAAFVCKDWYHVSRDPELWRGRFLSDFGKNDIGDDGDYRRKFIAHWRSGCWHCNTFVTADLISRTCPLHQNRPLCKECAKEAECQLISINSFMTIRDVQKSTIEALGIQTFDHLRKKTCYFREIVEKVLTHAEDRRRVLLEELTQEDSVSKQDIQRIRSLDLRSVYEGTTHIPRDTLQRILINYLGKSESQQKRKHDINEFLERTRVAKARGWT